jgi:pre-mRNA cleavage complex 2 protein Pcf11
LAQVLSSQRLDFATLNQIKNQIQPMMTSSAPAPQSNFLPSPSLNLSTPVGLQSLAALSGPIGLSSLSVAQLGSLDFLQSFPTNSIKGSSSISSPLLGLVQPVKKEQVVPAIIPKDVPIIRLDSSDINKRHPGLYYHLYEAIELQCKQCALRFPSHTIQGGKATLEAHLDWHFRQKKKQKEKNKRAISRDWYLTADDWLAEQPIDPISDNQGTNSIHSIDEICLVAPVFFGQEAEAVLVTMSAIPASATQTKCYICQETLEKYFDDEEDMWMVRGAVKSGEKVCYGSIRSLKHLDVP